MMDLEYNAGQGDTLLSEMILALMEEGELVTNSSQFRIDYDENAGSHAVSHCQFSGINNFHLPVNLILTPFLFVDFAIRNIFPLVYKENLIESTNYIRALVHARRSQEAIDDFRENSLYITASAS